MIPGLKIHPMREANLAFASDCTAAEGWVSENLTSLEGFYLHDPGGCFLAELAGKPVGICIATHYAQSGFIGELIVRSEARGRGVGADLLNHAVRYLQSRGVKTVYLDGVVKAVDLYERNGFLKICRSLRFSGKLAGRLTPGVRPMQLSDLPAVFALDWQAFGEDRSFFLARRLELFPELCMVMFEGGEFEGFIMGRRGEGWLAAGPWVVAMDAWDPLRLLEGLAEEAGDNPISIGVLEINRSAVEIIHSLGFMERPDSPWRMALGPDRELGASPQCLAVGTAAKG